MKLQTARTKDKTWILIFMMVFLVVAMSPAFSFSEGKIQSKTMKVDKESPLKLSPDTEITSIDTGTILTLSGGTTCVYCKCTIIGGMVHCDFYPYPPGCTCP